MATLTIRNLPDDVHDALRRRAAENRRSVEAEVRSVIQATVAARPTDDERKRAIARLQALRPSVQRQFPVGWSQSDEDAAEGHLEGAWENGLISDDEHRSWAHRMQQFEVLPADVEAFLDSRIRAE